MTDTGKMILKLIVLIAPSLFVLWVLYFDQKSDSSGGGGYDLSELVYSGLLTLFIVGWNVWMLISLLIAKTAVDKHNHKILLGVGVLVLVASAVWFFKQLH